MRFRRAPAPPEWFLALAPLPLAGLLLYLVSARYFVAMIPVLSIVGGIGLARIGRQDNFPIIHRLSGRSVVLLVVVLLSFWFHGLSAHDGRTRALWRKPLGSG